MNHFIGFIPKFAAVTEPFRDLMKKHSWFEWWGNHDKAFGIMKNIVWVFVENHHFDIRKETRVKCDASKKPRGCAGTISSRRKEVYLIRLLFLNEAEGPIQNNSLSLRVIILSVREKEFQDNKNKINSTGWPITPIWLWNRIYPGREHGVCHLHFSSPSRSSRESLANR